VVQAKSKNKEAKYNTAELSLIFPPLPLARELKVVQTTRAPPQALAYPD
jgi:hypothetical protein